MFSKLRYILFDFRDNFKNDFLDLFKKSIAFLVLGIIMFPFADKSEVVGGIGGVLLFVFGFMWGRDLISSLAIFGSISSNIMIKWTILIFLYLIGIAFGYIYFLWCVIKMIVVLIKKIK